MRRRILTAALTVFAERGFHGAAVPLVAVSAGVGTGTLYRYFESKEQLVNEVFRDAKARLKAAIFTDMNLTQEPRALFLDLWGRLGAFARTEPLAFQFLEMQDHVPYLDAQSRDAERAVLAPIWLLGTERLAHAHGASPPMEVTIAMVWGALVGLLKAERLGYLTLTPAMLDAAGVACWALLSAAPLEERKPAVGHGPKRKPPARKLGKRPPESQKHRKTRE